VKVIKFLKRLLSAESSVHITLGLSVAMIAICIVAIFGGSQSEKERLAFQGSQLEEREQVMKNVKITRTAAGLDVNYMIETNRLEQYPERKLAKLDFIRLTVIDQQGNQRVMTAPMGLYDQDSNKIEMLGGVNVTDTNGTDSAVSANLNTEKLTIELD